MDFDLSQLHNLQTSDVTKKKGLQLLQKIAIKPRAVPKAPPTSTSSAEPSQRPEAATGPPPPEHPPPQPAAASKPPAPPNVPMASPKPIATLQPPQALVPMPTARNIKRPRKAPAQRAPEAEAPPSEPSPLPAPKRTRPTRNVQPRALVSPDAKKNAPARPPALSSILKRRDTMPPLSAAPVTGATAVAAAIPRVQFAEEPLGPAHPEKKSRGAAVPTAAAAAPASLRVHPHHHRPGTQPSVSATAATAAPLEEQNARTSKARNAAQLNATDGSTPGRRELDELQMDTRPAPRAEETQTRVEAHRGENESLKTAAASAEGGVGGHGDDGDEDEDGDDEGPLLVRALHPKERLRTKALEKLNKPKLKRGRKPKHRQQASAVPAVGEEHDRRVGAVDAGVLAGVPHHHERAPKAAATTTTSDGVLSGELAKNRGRNDASATTTTTAEARQPQTALPIPVDATHVHERVTPEEPPASDDQGNEGSTEEDTVTVPTTEVLVPGASCSDGDQEEATKDSAASRYPGRRRSARVQQAAQRACLEAAAAARREKTELEEEAKLLERIYRDASSDSSFSDDSDVALDEDDDEQDGEGSGSRRNSRGRGKGRKRAGSKNSSRTKRKKPSRARALSKLPKPPREAWADKELDHENWAIVDVIRWANAKDRREVIEQSKDKRGDSTDGDKDGGGGGAAGAGGNADAEEDAGPATTGNANLNTSTAMTTVPSSAGTDDNNRVGKALRNALALPAEAEPAPAPRPVSLAPQVQVVDGRIVVNQRSLTVQAQEKQQYTRVVTEDGSRLNSLTYMNRLSNERWVVEDTELFYKALSQFGTDFTLISHLFPGRQRRHLKNKFTRESKLNPARVNDALRQSESVKTKSYKEMIAMLKESGMSVGGDATETPSEQPLPALPALPAPASVPVVDADDRDRLDSRGGADVGEQQGQKRAQEAAALQGKLHEQQGEGVRLQNTTNDGNDIDNGGGVSNDVKVETSSQHGHHHHHHHHNNNNHNHGIGGDGATAASTQGGAALRRKFRRRPGKEPAVEQN